MERLPAMKAYDEGLGAERRRALGAFYTPPAVIDAVLERTLVPKLRQCSTARQVLALTVYDPSRETAVFYLLRSPSFMAGWPWSLIRLAC